MCQSQGQLPPGFPGYALDRHWSNAITNNGAELLIRIVEGRYIARLRSFNGEWRKTERELYSKVVKILPAKKNIL